MSRGSRTMHINQKSSPSLSYGRESLTFYSKRVFCQSTLATLQKGNLQQHIRAVRKSYDIAFPLKSNLRKPL